MLEIPTECADPGVERERGPGRPDTKTLRAVRTAEGECNSAPGSAEDNYKLINIEPFLFDN
jgi:hypothetical protein